MSVHAVFWDLNKTQGEQWKTNAGTYAYFSFTGDITSYIRFMYNIYMNSLPFFNLHKIDAFDLEIISKTSQGEYFFEYYLPVTDKNHPVRGKAALLLTGFRFFYAEPSPW
ncbi:hypothetical protein GJ848_21825 [Salmonella enterica]|nr:hypothetical protein [Salmonella enterica]